MPNDQQQCEENGGIFNEYDGSCTPGGGADNDQGGDHDDQSGPDYSWQFEGVDLEDIAHSPWEGDAGGSQGSQWGMSSDFFSEGGLHTLGGDDLIQWLGQQGFSDSIGGLNWFMEEFGDSSIGDTLAFDPSDITELGTSFAMQEDAMFGEYSEWESGQVDILEESAANFQTLAQQQLNAFDLANQERRANERQTTADMRRQALQGIATTRRASARSGLSSGMGSTRALDSFMNQSRQQAAGSRAAQQDYLSQVTSTEEQRDFNISQATAGFEAEQASKVLGMENQLEQMQYNFASGASNIYDDWYSNLVGMTGSYFANTGFEEEDGTITNFDLFGTGGG